MLWSVGLIVLGLVLLVVGGELLLRGAVALATLLRMTPALIGLTVVAAGTSIPELAVSLVAAVQDKPDITIGNVVGSNIFNITFIVGLSALVYPLAIGGNTIKLEFPVLLLVTLMFMALGRDGAIDWFDGWLMMSVYVGFTAYLVSLVREQMNAKEQREFGARAQELSKGVVMRPGWMRSFMLLALGIVVLAGGAHATVTGAVELARLLGMTERVIGLTIVGAGTGLPEVVTTLVSSYRGRDDVAIGNVIGSNLFNLLIIPGVSGLVEAVPFNAAILHSDCWWMLATTALLFPLMYTSLRISRLEGGLLLGVYAAYLYFLLSRAAIDI